MYDGTIGALHEASGRCAQYSGLVSTHYSDNEAELDAVELPVFSMHRYALSIN